MIKLSERVGAISGSPTLKLVQIKNQLQAKGLKIFDFGAGEPDFPTPEHIKNAGITAIQKNFTKYTSTSGIVDLKKAIRENYLKEQGFAPEDTEIIVSPGSKFGMFLLLQAAVDPGEEVILPLPYWVSYPEIAKFGNARIVHADHISGAELFELTADSYIARYSPLTKVVVVNSPSNPTGKIMNAAELAKLVRFFYQKSVLTVIDDCYRKIMYSTEPYPSPFALVPEARDCLAVVSSLSKTYSMTGWRLGYTIAPQSLCAAMTKIQEHSTSNASSITQKAAVAALNGPEDEIIAMVSEYRQRRDTIARRFDKIGNIRYRLPDGAFYFFADFGHFIRKKGKRNDQEFAMDILEKLNVIVVPGSAFGAPNYLRISFATAMADIEAGLDLLEKYLLTP